MKRYVDLAREIVDDPNWVSRVFVTFVLAVLPIGIAWFFARLVPDPWNLAVGIAVWVAAYNLVYVGMDVTIKEAIGEATGEPIRPQKINWSAVAAWAVFFGFALGLVAAIEWLLPIGWSLVRAWLR